MTQKKDTIKKQIKILSELINKSNYDINNKKLIPDLSLLRNKMENLSNKVLSLNNSETIEFKKQFDDLLFDFDTLESDIVSIFGNTAQRVNDKQDKQTVGKNYINTINDHNVY